MSYGAPVQQRRFLGLDTRRKEARNDGSALVARNMEIRQVGSIRKRLGIMRTVDRIFTGAVSAIIPTRHCFFLEQFIFGITPASDFSTFLDFGPAPQGVKVRPVTNFDVTAVNAAPIHMQLTWNLPKTKWLSGIKILRKVNEDPIDPDGNFTGASTLIYFGPPKESHNDFNVVAEVNYHYSIWTFWFQDK